jgi:hypothetical protein
MTADLERPLIGVPENFSAAYRSQFRIGGISVQMLADCADFVTLVPPLEPFRAAVETSDINIQVNCVAKLTVPPRAKVFDSGKTWRLYEGDAGFQFDFIAAIFGEQPFKRLHIDRQFRRATLQMNGECIETLGHSVEPLGYPLDELLIMHRLTQEKAIELHSCGIVRPDGTGNLFVGHSGAGKSTTTRLWTAREDVEILSDDRIIVRRDATGACDGAGKQQVLRLRDCSASQTNYFAQDDKGSGMRMYGTPWHGEAMYASPGSAPLARIFILEHGQGNVLTRLSPSQAVAELFARAFVPFHRHEYVDSALEFLQEVVSSVPCYRFAFEPNQRAVDTILNFHD